MAHKTIKNKEELINWAKRVNLCTNRKGMPDLQDEFAHSNVEDMRRIICGLDGWTEADLPFFSIFQAMGHYTFMNHLRIYVDNLADKAFQELKAQYHKELDAEREKIRQEAAAARELIKEFDSLNAQVKELTLLNRSLQDTADKLTDENERRSRDMLELTEELSTHRTFKKAFTQYMAA